MAKRDSKSESQKAGSNAKTSKGRPLSEAEMLALGKRFLAKQRRIAQGLDKHFGDAVTPLQRQALDLVKRKEAEQSGRAALEQVLKDFAKDEQRIKKQVNSLHKKLDGDVIYDSGAAMEVLKMVQDYFVDDEENVGIFFTLQSVINAFDGERQIAALLASNKHKDALIKAATAAGLAN